MNLLGAATPRIEHIPLVVASRGKNQQAAWFSFALDVGNTQAIAPSAAPGSPASTNHPQDVARAPSNRRANLGMGD